MLQDPQVLGNDHNKPHSLMSDPISTMYFHNMSCDLLNKILFKPTLCMLGVFFGICVFCKRKKWGSEF